MFAQQVSKLLPLLAAIGLFSSVLGVALAQPQYTKCVASEPGGANRTFDCQKRTGCRVGPHGTCEYGGVQVSPKSGDSAVENWSDYCAAHTEGECVVEDTQSVCLSYRGFLENSSCTMKGDLCIVYIKKNDCHTDF